MRVFRDHHGSEGSMGSEDHTSYLSDRPEWRAWRVTKGLVLGLRSSTSLASSLYLSLMYCSRELFTVWRRLNGLCRGVRGRGTAGACCSLSWSISSGFEGDSPFWTRNCSLRRWESTGVDGYAVEHFYKRTGRFFDLYNSFLRNLEALWFFKYYYARTTGFFDIKNSFVWKLESFRISKMFFKYVFYVTQPICAKEIITFKGLQDILNRL